MIQYTSEVKATLIDSLASDIDVARAAWVSNYGEEAREKDPKAIEGLIKFLYNNKHMSPFEHGIFKFYIDCPIFVAREFMRHRTFSFNEVSGRYKKLDGRFYVPSSERPLIQEGKVGAYTFVSGSDEQYALTRHHLERSYRYSWETYENLLEIGVAKEVARDCLPVATMTQFYASVDPRNLMQFLTLRNDKHALYEIRQIAVQMEAALEVCMPLTYKAYVTARDKERYPEIVVKNMGTQLATEKYKAPMRAGKPNPDYRPDNLSGDRIQMSESAPLDIKPERTPANGGLVCDGRGEVRAPEWFIDSYVPKHRAGDTYNITINMPDDMDTVADLIARTDRFGRRKLEKVE